MGLFQRDWLVSGAKATVVLIHGTGEHHGRYQHVAAYLNRHGFGVYSGDLPGWGRSPGLKGHVDRFDDYLEAVEEWVNEARARNPAGHPVFVLGHSLGGLIVTRFVQQYGRRASLAGVILSSPCLQVKVPVPGWKAKLAQLLNRIWPTLRLPNEITPQMVTRDEIVREQYRSDPNNYAKVSVRWFNELQTAMQQAWAQRDKLDLPLLVLQAGADCLVDPDAVETFVQALPNRDKQLVLYPGLFHEVFNEPERETVLRELVEWLNVKTGNGQIR
jgi:lysophospholipase